ncbi:alpha/beta hydrolase [Pseudalkalibacillus hwajinpoensis]|uniref:alpha/beta fold hydrolase n=1 Tax=Guptibacillus hwajinpoensis TaxID=208199 RepID=UPI00325B5C97
MFARVQKKKKIANVILSYEYYKHALPNRQTLVFIHGFLSSSFSFRKLFPLLSKDFNLLCFDLPGFGESEKNCDIHYSLHDHGALTNALLEEMNIQKAVLVGHSMGGQIALRTCIQHPERIEKLVLLCSSSYIKSSSPALRMCSYFPFFPYCLSISMSAINLRKNFEHLVYDHKLLTKEVIDGYTTSFNEKGFYLALCRLIRDREEDLSTSALNKINFPALLIWGSDDRLVPLRVGERMKKDLPDADLLVFPHTGHLIPEERPEETSYAIRQFLMNRSHSQSE